MSIDQLFIVVGCFVGTSAILFGVRYLLLKLLDKKSNASGAILAGVRRVIATPSLFWIIAVAAIVAVQVSHLPDNYAVTLNRVLQVGLLMSVVIVVSNFCEVMVRHGLQRTRPRMADSGLIKGIIRVVVYGTGLVMILSQLGVQIGPLLTAMGVGGLIFALAFKDTAENLFAGINLLIDRSVEVGDLIKLENGQEGIVDDIGWRVSKVNLKQEGILIIPNLKLAQNITIRKKKDVGSKGSSDSSLLKKVS